MNSDFPVNNPQSAIRNPQSKFLYWLPPILWLAAISFFSTDNFSGENTGTLLWSIFHSIFPSLTEEQFRPIHFLIRKAAHFTEYGILAFLLFRAFRSGMVKRWRWSSAISTFSIVVCYSLLDEYHQILTKTRVGSINDSLTDVAGGFTVLFVIWLLRESQES